VTIIWSLLGKFADLMLGKLFAIAVPAGAIIGGFTERVLGRNSNPSRQASAGVGGALLGGIAASALKGDRRSPICIEFAIAMVWKPTT